MDQSGIVFFHVLGRDDLVDPLVPYEGAAYLEGRDIRKSLHALSLHPLQDLEFGVSSLLHDISGLGFQDDHVLAPRLAFHPHFGVIVIGVDRNCHVGRQRPRRGGPDQERVVMFCDRHPHHYGRVALVPIFDLRLGKGGLASRTPGYHTVRVFEEAAFVCPGQGPPGGLDIFRFKGLIRIVPVHPHSELFELLRHAGPQVQSVLLAGGYELVDAHVLLDLLLRVYAHLLLDLHFYGQTVHVESGLVADVEPVHPPISDHDVLDGLVHGRTQVYLSGGVRGAVAEIEVLSAGPVLLGLLVRVRFFPELLDPSLDFWCVIICTDLLYHRSSFCVKFIFLTVRVDARAPIKSLPAVFLTV